MFLFPISISSIDKILTYFEFRNYFFLFFIIVIKQVNGSPSNRVGPNAFGSPTHNSKLIGPVTYYHRLATWERTQLYPTKLAETRRYAKHFPSLYLQV